jgi:hypothetical protein
MKKSLVLFLSIALLLSACKKDHNDSSNAANTWNFKGTDYTAASVAYVNGGSAANLSAAATGATATSADQLTFGFITPPTSSGQLLITDSGDPNTLLVSVSKLSGTSTTFYLNQETNVMANVTVNNGKISVSFPGTIWLYNLANSNDSAQLSVGTITQQ